jgi:hypothetical protein
VPVIVIFTAQCMKDGMALGKPTATSPVRQSEKRFGTSVYTAYGYGDEEIIYCIDGVSP